MSERDNIIAAMAGTLDATTTPQREDAGDVFTVDLLAYLTAAEGLYPNHLTDVAQGAGYASELQENLGAAVTGLWKDNLWRTQFLGAVADGILEAQSDAAEVEFIQDTVAAFVVAGTGILVTYNDPANTLIFAVDVAGGGGLGGVYQPLDATLTALAGLTTAADKGMYFTGVDAAAVYSLTAFGRTLGGVADAAAGRTALGLGTLAVQNANAVAITGGSVVGITDLLVADGGTGASTASGARTNLGLVIGTDVQAWDADLDAFAGLTGAADKLPYFTGAHALSLADFTAYARTLLDDSDASTARATLGLTIGSAVEAWDGDLDALAALSGTGYARRTGTSAWTLDATIPWGSVSGTPTTLAGYGITDAQPLDAELTALASVTSAADKVPYFTGSGTAAVASFTPWARTQVALTTLASNGVLYGNGSGAILSLAVNATATNKFLTQSSSGAPAWATIVAGDVPDLSATYQPLAANLTAIAGLTSAADKLPYFTGSGTAAVTTLSAFIRTLLDDADAATARTTLGLGNVENTALSTWAGTTNLTTLGTVTTGTWSATAVAIAKGGTGQTTAAAAFDALSPMTTLGDLIYGGTSGANTRLAGITVATRKFLRQLGTGSASAAPAWDTLTSGDIPDLSGTYQPLDATLTALAGLSTAADKGIYFTGTDAASVYALTAFGRTLGGAADAAAARTSLGVGTGDSPTLTGLTLSGLTTGRVVYTTTGGQLTADGNLTWDGSLLTLAAGKAVVANGTGGGTGSAIQLIAAQPVIRFSSTGNLADEKEWDIVGGNGKVFQIRARTDAFASVNALQITRGTSNALSDISLGSGSNTYTFGSTGTATFSGTVAGVASTWSSTLNVSGVATLANATDATSSTAAGTIISGGAAVALSAYVGGSVFIGNTTDTLLSGFKAGISGGSMVLWVYGVGVNGANLTLGQVNGTFGGALSANATNINLGQLFFDGYDGAARKDGAAIRGRTTETWAVGANGAQLTFAVTPNTTTGNGIKMILDQNGFLVVGSSSNPTYSLDVLGTTGVVRTAAIRNTTNSASAGARLYAEVAGTSATGDAYAVFAVGTTGESVAIGWDVSATAFVASYAASSNAVLGTGNLFSATSTLWTFPIAVSMSSTLSVTGDFAVNVNKFTVTASNGNTLVAGTFDVTGNSHLVGRLVVDNRVESNFVSGNTTPTFLAASADPRFGLYRTDALADEGKWEMAAGTASLIFRTRSDSGTAGAAWLTVARGTGNASSTATYTVPVAGTASTWSSTLGVTGAATFSSTISAGLFSWDTQTLELGGELVVLGSSIIDADLSVTGYLDVDGNLTLLGSASFASTLAVTGALTGAAATFSGALTAGSLAGITSGNLTWDGKTLEIATELVVLGSAIFDAGIDVGDTITGSPTTAAGAGGLVIPHGVAMTTPPDGLIWTTTAGMFVRVNGVTKTVTLT